MRKFTFPLVVALVATFAAGDARATLIIDVQAVSATGGAIVLDGKNLDLSCTQLGAVVTFDVWARFTTGTGGSSGNDSITQIQGGMGSIRGSSSFVVAGNISTLTMTPGVWDESGSQGGIPTPNAVGDMVIPVTPAGSVWSARNPVAQPVDATTLATLLGTFTYTVTAVGQGEGFIAVNFDPFTTLTIPAGTWKENGVAYNSLSNVKAYQDYAAGDPVFYAPIPEPSTLALLAMSVIGLIAWAWRRRSV